MTEVLRSSPWLALGSTEMRSTFSMIAVGEGGLFLSGTGYGHGVGASGALGVGRRGWSPEIWDTYRDITLGLVRRRASTR